MAQEKLDILFINGVRDSGTVDVVRGTAAGRLIFSTAGSCHVSSFLAPERINVSHFALDHLRQQQIDTRHLLRHDLVFCEIADPDSHTMALNKACRLHGLVQDRLPWVNDPHRIPGTGREKIPGLLADIEGITVPRVIRVKPRSIADLEAAIEAGGLKLPVLIRPTGSHGGQSLVLIKTTHDLQHLLLARFHEAFISEFVDTSENGIYAKYRIAVINGEAFIRHVIFSNHWIVHSESRTFMSEHPEFQDREAQLLDSFDARIKPQIASAIAHVHERIGLDYFGIDCAFSDGRLTLFEVNANMNILNNNQPLPNIWQQPIRHMQDCILENLILGRIARFGA
ncbi:MAG: hypothetical protein R3F41_14430 [Gammaproteobacteria bacterium]|nr:hypothetical protein [Pseudomonadales bacterium]MCP5347174.1 hypothetical protein [Pseudomonadales bacterium]